MDISNLVMWVMGVVLIGIGVPLFFIGRYLSAPEDKKRQIAQGIKVIAIIWIAIGILIYIRILIVS